jgi:hypothetical protein
MARGTTSWGSSADQQRLKRQLEGSGRTRRLYLDPGNSRGVSEPSSSPSPRGEKMALDALPLEVFHCIASCLSPAAVFSLALASKTTYARVFAGGGYLWKQLVEDRYDEIKFDNPDHVDWKFIYQSRTYSERRLNVYPFGEMVQEEHIWPDESDDNESGDEGEVGKLPRTTPPGIWRVSGRAFLGVIRDLVMQNSKSHHRQNLISSYQKSQTSLSRRIITWSSPPKQYPRQAIDVLTGLATRAMLSA